MALYSNGDGNIWAVWAGGFYELALELGPVSDERFGAAVQALWGDPSLNGCYLRNDIEPDAQPKIAPSLSLVEDHHVYGVATLPTGARIACGMVALRDFDGVDRVAIYVPMAALENELNVGAFPFDDDRDSRDWRPSIDAWLIRIARSVYNDVPFGLALIGHEGLAEDSSDQVETRGVPSERWFGYLIPNDGEFTWYPAAAYTAPITVSPTPDRV